MGGQAGSQPARTATISGGQDENEERRYFTDLLTEFTERLLLLLLPWNVRGKFGCKFGNTGARVLRSLAWWRGWGEGDVHVERSKSFCMSVVASWRWLGSAPFWCTLSPHPFLCECAREGWCGSYVQHHCYVYLLPFLFTRPIIPVDDEGWIVGRGRRRCRGVASPLFMKPNATCTSPQESYLGT